MGTSCPRHESFCGVRGTPTHSTEKVGLGVGVSVIDECPNIFDTTAMSVPAASNNEARPSALPESGAPYAARSVQAPVPGVVISEVLRQGASAKGVERFRIR